MNKTELKQFLTDNLNSTSSRRFFHQDFPDVDTKREYYDEEVLEFLDKLVENKINWEQIEQVGGEGEGDDYWVVTEFTTADAKVYVKFDGWYQSYNGSEFTEWFFVEPKEVVVTKYQKVE